MNEKDFNNFINKYNDKYHFEEWISMTKINFDILENKSKFKWFSFFEKNKSVIINIKEKIKIYKSSN